MIATRPDWCISRQTLWGVPIIVFYCEGCQEPLTDRKILDRVVDQFRHNTADVWYSQSAAELAGPDAKCGKCGGNVVPQRDRHSGRLVRFRREPSGSADAREFPALACRHVSRRRRSVSRLVPQLAADRRGAEGRALLSRHRDERLDARRRRARAFEIERQRGGGKDHQQIRRGTAAPVGRVDRFHRGRAPLEHDPRSLDRGLSQAAQHVPLCARATCTISIPRRTPCRSPRCWKSTAGSWRGPKI